MSKIRVCFLGTPEFAATCMKSVLADSHFEIVGVVTQPDRPAGRKLQLTPSPVKVLALSHGLPVLSPESLKKDPSAVEEIRSWKAEVAIVVAFGQILTEEFMGMFNFGAVNVHASLLPRWRGAAPIQRSVEAGDAETGVALQKMVKKLDAGDVLGVRKIQLDDKITALELHDQLALMGAELLRVELMDYVRGNLAGAAQDENQVTHAKKIDKLESEILWSTPAKTIHNKIRALTMGPGSFTLFAGKKIKIHRTVVATSSSQNRSPGRIHSVESSSISVETADGLLQILELQPESKSRMSVADFLKGHTLKAGDVFGK